MRKYLVRRVFFLIMVIWTAASINFILPHLTGRDPIHEMMVNRIATQGLSPQNAQNLIDTYTRLFGLDKPLWQQYLTYIVNVVQFKFGYSIPDYPRTVLSIMIERGRITLPFLIVGIALAVISIVVLSWK